MLLFWHICHGGRTHPPASTTYILSLGPNHGESHRRQSLCFIYPIFSTKFCSSRERLPFIHISTLIWMDFKSLYVLLHEMRPIFPRNPAPSSFSNVRCCCCSDCEFSAHIANCGGVNCLVGSAAPALVCASMQSTTRPHGPHATRPFHGKPRHRAVLLISVRPAESLYLGTIVPFASVFQEQT